MTMIQKKKKKKKKKNKSIIQMKNRTEIIMTQIIAMQFKPRVVNSTNPL